MEIVIGIILIILIGMMIFFHIPYSKTRKSFERDAQELMNNVDPNEVFTVEDIKDLPLPIKRYFHTCGFIGRKKMQYLNTLYRNVQFGMGVGKRTIRIDYSVVNGVKNPDRIAYINSKLFGIPFEGLDRYIQGEGSMCGILGKVIPLFQQGGPEFNSSSLVTVLSECLLIPTVALSNYVKWEEIDDYHAKATITYYGQSLEGIFTFNPVGEMIEFTTNDRTSLESDGKMEKVPWTVRCENYCEQKGYKLPAHIQAIWHYASGDYVYFDSNNIDFNYDN